MEFLNWLKDKAYDLGLNFELYYSSIMDFCFTIGYKTTHPKHGEKILVIQSCDLNYVMAKAETEFKEWLMENYDGY